MASRYLFDYMAGNDWRIVGPNVPVLEKSERQGDRYLRWFHDETGTVPQMFHNFYSLGWDAHRQAMLRFTGCESEADAAVRNRYGIAHWGILYDGRHKIPVPLPNVRLRMYAIAPYFPWIELEALSSFFARGLYSEQPYVYFRW